MSYDFTKDPIIAEYIETDRPCPVCGGNLWSESGHSIGRLHAVCPNCPLKGERSYCPDCDEGDV